MILLLDFEKNRFYYTCIKDYIYNKKERNFGIHPRKKYISKCTSNNTIRLINSAFIAVLHRKESSPLVYTIIDMNETYI